MKRNKNSFVLLIISLLVFYFLFQLFQNAENIKQAYPSVSIRYQKSGITRRQIDSALSNEESKGSFNIPEITAWSYEAAKKLQNPVLNRSAEYPVAYVSGDMMLSVPMNLLCGNYPLMGDSYGCVIDDKTAYELFGSTDVVDNLILCDKKTYYIRAVVKTNSQIILIQSSDANRVFNNIELLYDEKENAEALAEEFLYQNGLSEKYEIIDGYVYAKTIWFSLTLLVFILYGFLLYIWIRYILIDKRMKERIANRRNYVLLILMSAVGASVIGYYIFNKLGPPVYIPMKYIPSRWSDFEHWSFIFHDFREQIQKIKYLTPNPKDVFLMDAVNKMGYHFAIALGSIIIILQQMRLCFITKV